MKNLRVLSTGRFGLADPRVHGSWIGLDSKLHISQFSVVINAILVDARKSCFAQVLKGTVSFRLCCCIFVRRYYHVWFSFAASNLFNKSLFFSNKKGLDFVILSLYDIFLFLSFLVLFWY